MTAITIMVICATVYGALSTKEFRITQSTTPSGPSATGTTGTIYWDSDYIYICIATNTWMRAPIATWAAVVEFIKMEDDAFIQLEDGTGVIIKE